MDIIVETDLGRDPDDFFALCYLHGAGYHIRAITISPGDPDQIAIAKGLMKELGLQIPVGAARGGDKSSSGGVHEKFLRRYGHPLREAPDSVGSAVIHITKQAYPDAELFVCGPPQNVGRYLEEFPDTPFRAVTIQGGFVPYSVHTYDVPRLDKFEGRETVATFNLNGDPKAGEKLIQSGSPLRMVGKNVCHTIVYDKERHRYVQEVAPTSRAGELFREVMSMYLENHTDKKFHDPTAAVCMRHPEIGTWVMGHPYRTLGRWGTRPDPVGHPCLVDVDRTALWEHIRSMT